ncbi:MAG TPA: Lrp/AsnC family transcriptional regulator [Candidatus Bilamarchaeaceae archaeon]|nr:Lrp/AsnC family transcriptional regulator [Candidatus Bilamarchaeaceae archaeon]
MEKTAKLDLKDRKILRELDMNARIPMNELAKKVGLSRQVVQYRIQRMEKEGVVLGAITIFDSAVVGQRWFRVAIQLKSTQKERNQIIEFLKNNQNIIWLGEVGGNWDLVVNFAFEDHFEFNQSFEKFLEEYGNVIQKYEVLIYINVRDQPRTYILEDYEIKETYLFHEMKFNPTVKLDGLDKKIIGLISKNAFLSLSQIGTKLNVNYKTIQNRLKQLEKNKVILGYRVFVNPSNLNYESYMIFLGIQRFNQELEKKLYEFLKHPNVTFLVKQLGRWGLGMEIEVKKRKEFQEFLVELRTHFGEMISEYETFPIFYDHVFNYFPDGALD